MELHWVASLSASSCHVADGMRRGWPLTDPRLGEGVVAAARQLQHQLASAGFGRGPFWEHLLAYAHEIDSNQALARMAMRKSLGASAVSDSVVAAIAARIGDLEREMLGDLPRLVDDLEHRIRPLQQHWEARGPGLLNAVGSLTDPRLIVDNATAVAVHPAFGGGGSASLGTNSIRIEALLTNVLPELPEVVRLGWLLAQLNVDLPMFAERVPGPRLSTVAQLGLLPPILSAGEVVELTSLSPFTVSTAVASWRIDVSSDSDVPPILLDWWATYRETRPTWDIALAALDQMLGDAIACQTR